MASRIDIVFLIIIILLIILVVYNPNQYCVVKNEKTPLCRSEKISNCFYKNYNDIDKLTRPKVFIHISDERNERNWINFGSRTTTDLNLGVCELCIETTIDSLICNYDIILYTNDDVKHIVNDKDDYLCNIENVELLSGTDLKQWESYCRFRILYKYGGIVMSPCFLFSKTPSNSVCDVKQLTVCNTLNEGLNSSNERIISTGDFMILAPEKDKYVKIYLDYLKQLCYHFYTSDSKYFDKNMEHLLNLNSLSPQDIGIADSNNREIHIENILSSENIKLSSSNFCLFVNIDLLKKNRKYGWILKMNKDQIKESNFFLANYLK
uniref:Uncharacterized protein n=1 Tax=Florenciella sp. virus SA2 TaxID=3240092 RepID=A0AB39JEF0_9VIRU